MILKKVLVIQTASIGDVILSTPVVERLHASDSTMQIDLLIKRGNEALFAGHPFIGHLYVWDKRDHKYAQLWQILKQVRSERYDAVINIQRFATTGFLTALSGAKRRIGFKKNPLAVLFTHRVDHIISTSEHPVHEVERNSKLLLPLNIEGEAPMRLYPQSADWAMVSEYKSHRYICVAPSSLWFTKAFPVEKWIEFISSVPHHLYVYLLGGPDDMALAEKIITASGHQNTLNLCGKLTMLQSAALMRDAAMNYVNDSAPMHLASSQNAPVTAIYCSTVPAFGFGPRSDNAVVIESEEVLDCKPCGLHGQKSCPRLHFKCGRSIDIVKLIERLS